MSINLTKEQILGLLPSYELLKENYREFREFEITLAKNMINAKTMDSKDLKYLYKKINQNAAKSQEIRKCLEKEVINVLSILLHPLSDYDSCDIDDVFEMYCKDMNDLRVYYTNDSIDLYLFDFMSDVLYHTCKNRSSKNSKSNTRKK